MPNDTTPSDRRRIYVDLDDVLSETIEPLMQLARQLFGRSVALETVREFDLARGFSLSETQLAELMDAAHVAEHLESFAPKPGAQGTLARWDARGYEVSVLTGRPPGTAAASRRWLARHALAHRHFACVDKYGRWDESAPAEETLALEALAEQAFVLAVEDSAEMAVYLAERCDVPVALIDRPWNHALPPHSAAAGRRIVRCRHWDDVAQHFGTP